MRTIGNLKKYDEELAKKREEKRKAVESIEESLVQVPLQQANIASQLGKTSNEDVRNILLAQIEKLAEEKTKLLAAKERLERESGVSLQSLEVELRDLENSWPDYPIGRRVALINFLVKEVVVDIVASHWLRVQVLWLHDQWGREELYYCRAKGSNNWWSEQDDAILREHYPASPRQEIMELMPSRGWASIRARANLLGVERKVYNEEGKSQKFSYDDLRFMQSKGIGPDVKTTRWEPVYQQEV